MLLSSNSIITSDIRYMKNKLKLRDQFSELQKYIFIVIKIKVYPFELIYLNCIIKFKIRLSKKLLSLFFFQVKLCLLNGLHPIQCKDQK